MLRPGIERAFRRDIDAFYLAAAMIELLAPFARRLRPMDVIPHFEGVVMGELDLRLEGCGGGGIRREHREGRRLPGAEAGLAAVGPPGDDAGLGRGHSDWAMCQR